MAKASKEKIYEVDLSQIDEPHEINRLEIDPDEVSELAKSISETGLLQPILLRPDGDRYEIVAGQRRFLAHQQLELSVVKSIVRVMTDQEAAVLRATENLSRVNLTQIEEGAVYSNLINGHGMTIDQIAKRMGKSAGIVKRRLDLMKMPPRLQKAIHSGQIVAGVAEELWRISDPGDMDYHLELAIDNGVTRAVARQWVDDWAKQQRAASFGGERGGGISPPYLDRPHYITCGICEGPSLIENATTLMVCPDCQEMIHNRKKEVT